MVVPSFPTKNDHFGVFWGYHHLRKHPYIVCILFLGDVRFDKARFMRSCFLAGGWTNPFEKYAEVKMGSSSPRVAVHSKDLPCHQVLLSTRLPILVHSTRDENKTSLKAPPGVCFVVFFGPPKKNLTLETFIGRFVFAQVARLVIVGEVVLTAPGFTHDAFMDSLGQKFNILCFV